MSSEYISASEKIRQIQLERYENLKWTQNERLLRDRSKHIDPCFIGKNVPFKLLAEVKFKRSIFGPFIDIYNTPQNQDKFLNDNKLSILKYNMNQLDRKELQHLEDDNNFIENIYNLLVRAVDEKEIVNYEYLYENIFALRFCDTPLNFIDGELKKFRRLRVLILCGNWILDVNGKYLPRTLEYIELFGNQIEYLTNFTNHVPKKFLHIGFQRNWLTHDSHLHLLGNPEKFQYLKNLDLSENDIYDLETVCECLKQLESLTALHLQGNPCSVINTYKDDVLRSLPQLLFLDGTEITEDDRELNPHDIKISAAITFTCHRVLSILQPKEEKGISHEFYFEIGLPLLEDVIFAPEETNKKSSGDIKKFESKKSIRSPPRNIKSSTNPYDAPDEQENDKKSKMVNTAFKTERFQWQKIIQLPEEALVIESPDNNYTDIRDTFRSSVNVKFIYLKVVAPSGKADKKSKPGKNKKELNEKRESIPEPEEIILKKITFADFWCDLHSINWSDKTIDFFWTDHPKFKTTAIEIEGNLRALNYVDNTGKKGNEKMKKNLDVTSPLPNQMTIHLGFGLKRDFPQS